MSTIEATNLQRDSVWVIYSQRNEIMLDPDYQRESDIWGLEKRQLLIDSLINGFDIPKIYFHSFFPPKEMGNRKYKYAIIDGKQRIQTVWDFIDGKFNLSEKFEYIKNPKINLSGLFYSDLALKHPEIKANLDATPLSIYTVTTDDQDLIEEMFSRLNEAVPLNAPEKRQALGGPLPKAFKTLSANHFFTKCLPFKNRRYRFLDIAAKFLYLEENNGSRDTKKIYLDDFVKTYKRNRKNEGTEKLVKASQQVLSRMGKFFSDKDQLLKSVGILTIYYLLFQSDADFGEKHNRNTLADFEDTRKQNRLIAEEDLAGANYELVEFDRLSQSPNDKVAIDYRLQVIKDFISDPAKYKKAKKN